MLFSKDTLPFSKQRCCQVKLSQLILKAQTLDSYPFFSPLSHMVETYIDISMFFIKETLLFSFLGWVKSLDDQVEEKQQTNKPRPQTIIFFSLSHMIMVLVHKFFCPLPKVGNLHFYLSCCHLSSLISHMLTYSTFNLQYGGRPIYHNL